MQVIGHRGSAGTAPENTLAGIREGLRAGVEWLEIDVRFVDNELLVIHDETLDRTTNGQGSIYGLNAAAIRALDAGDGEKIPTLREALETIDAKAHLNIELKDCPSLRPTSALVSSLLAIDPRWHNKIMFSTFEDAVHADMAETLPEGCILGVLFNDIPSDAVEYAQQLNAYSLNLSFAQMTPELIAKSQGAGLKVFVYTVNEPEHIKTCKTLGVDGIYTDFPESTLKLLNDINLD